MSFAPDVLPTSLARALDLTGVLCVPAVFQDLVRCADDDERNTAQDGLQTIIEAQASDVKLKRFITGDAAIAWLYLEETRDRPTERGAALSQLATETGVDYSELQQCFAVARAFPPDVRDPYLQKDNKWTWFVNLACRTALEGERWGPAREERIRSLSAECADLNTTATRKRVEAVTGKGEPRVKAALVNQDDSREDVEAHVDQTHGFVDEFRQPECPTPDAGNRALILSLQQQLNELRDQMQAFGQPVDTDALLERARDGLSLKLYRELGIADEKASRIAQEAENRFRVALRGLVVYRKAGAS